MMMTSRRTGFDLNILFAIGLTISLILFGGMVFAQGASCQYCGMKQAKFGHSWMHINYEDGSMGGFCSVHCAAIDFALHIDKAPKTITVGDYNTKKQIDAEKAHWVIGGSKMGVMTTRAKWAFQNKADADAFINAHGGEPATFETVLKAAFEDMYQDTLMIRKKRKMMRMRKMKSHN